MYSGTDNLKYTRGTTRIDKTQRVLSSLTLNARSRTILIKYPYTKHRFRQSAPECSLRQLPRTALSVGDAVFLSFSLARVSFMAFDKVKIDVISIPGFN